MVLGRGPLGGDYVMGVELLRNGFSVLMNAALESSLAPSVNKEAAPASHRTCRHFDLGRSYLQK